MVSKMALGWRLDLPCYAFTRKSAQSCSRDMYDKQDEKNDRSEFKRGAAGILRRCDRAYMKTHCFERR